MATYSQVCSAVGSFGYANRFTLYVVLTNRNGDPATNKSVVDYNVYFENTSGGGTFTSNTRLYFALNGGVIKDSTSSITGPRNGQVSIASGSITVDHNNDGTKAIGFHALVQGVSFGIKGEISGTFTLNTIPRASSVSGGSGNIGGTTTITISRASTNFTHTLRYVFGTLNNTIAAGVGTSYTWTIPTSFYAQIPNDKTGIGTLYCDTYNGSTLIGSKSVGFTVTVTESSSRPTVSATLTDTNATTKALTGNASKMVKGKSTGQLIITSTARNSATIKSVTINGENVGSATSITKNYANISTASFAIITTDSRGYTNTSYVLNPTYVNYVPLTLNATIFRPQPTGTEIKMTYSGNYFNGSFGAVTNTLSITWKYKVKGASSWTNGGTITPTLSGNTISSKTISLGTNYNYQTAYEFQITAVDKLTTITQTLPMSVGLPVFNWGKDYFNVNGDIRRHGLSTHYLYAQATTPKNGTSIDAVNGGGELQRTKICSIYDASNNWYNLINIRHQNGEGDGVWYGMQIRRHMINLNNSLQTRAESNGVWTSWEQIPRCKVLYDNTSGTTGTVTLIETAASFAYLEIFYTLNGNVFKSVRVISPDGKRIVLDGLWVAPDMGLIQTETKTYTISGKNITPQTESWYANLVSTGVGSLGTQNTLKIFRVNGYR